MRSKFISKNIIFLLIFSVFFWIIALKGALSTGALGDEAGPAIHAMNVKLGTDTAWIGEGFEIKLSGKKMFFPLTYSAYYDIALRAYMLIPFITVFGAEVIALKVFSVFFSWLLLIAVFLLINRYFGFREAVFTLIISALSPSYLIYSRILLIHQEIMINAVYFFALFFALKYLTDKNNYKLYAAFLLIGLTFSMKISASTRIVGLALQIMFFSWKYLWNYLKKIRFNKTLIAALIFFALGASIFIQYNIKSSFEPVRSLYSAIIQKKSVASINHSTQYVKNIKHRFRQYYEIISEKGQDYYYQLGTTPLMKFWFFGIFIISLIVVPVLYKGTKRKVIFSFYLFFFMVLLITSFSPGSLDPGHISSMYPFHFFMVALLICRLLNLTNKTAFKLLIIVITIWPYPVMAYYYNKRINNSGGYQLGAPPFREIIEYLKINNDKTVFVLEGEFQGVEGIPFLTNGKIGYIEPHIFHYIDNWIHQRNNAKFIRADFKELIRDTFNRKGTSYLIRRPDKYIFNHKLRYGHDVFFEIIKELEYKFELILSPKNNFGDNFFELYIVYGK